ncbi:hypothetical protein C1H57_12645 [Clostridium sp. 2-1]|uniref:ImmA/IrrE family metallo-endopeptidase n=1 Tax=Clostridium TaxID=1485 RepID=UPI000CDA1212|nr:MULTISPECIES: ImmA/IrrE family metallo-endopeptidase [Clostridium]MBN7575983.1 ImmA/IrrE family metallo-endopeptidase [Clostridium beijerinckii]MBN7581184.1 ImmA/IrrE family metallo-endopeptidase [Clostridium beijerinckii]MBN7585704.1 ImmA/IrrE family metallo-endopeptidase [Clostridium beijerinckii]MBO0521493.1 ImmA/IrrE family metallo-endopeptidase [Clostridium beijerinckii]POO91028.1 hypothetical protein C1H57_12645 [Clostridium sp. 2-1]
MTKYEKLLIEAEDQGVEVIEVDLGTNKKCGKYLNNKNESIIIINSNITDIEKHEVLAEELGHHHTTYGNITNLDDIRNKKLELVARRDGFKTLVEPIDIVNAMRNGATNIYELAEYVHVTVDTFYTIIEDLRKQYGLGIPVGNYYIQLEPSFGIYKDIDGLFNYNGK